MNITVNGEATAVSEDATVAEVVSQALPAPRRSGVAVARNGQVVRRGAWADTTLRDGDAVEILVAAQGG